MRGVQFPFVVNDFVLIKVSSLSSTVRATGSLPLVW